MHPHKLIMQVASSGNFFNCITLYNYEVKLSNSLSEQIKALRKRRGWTQLDLATRLGVEQSTVSRWERDISRPIGIYLNFLQRLLAGRRVRK